MLTPAAKVKES